MAGGRRRVVLAAAAAAVLPCAAAWGQDTERRVEQALRRAEAGGRLRADTNLSMAERALLDIGGAHTFTFLNLNDDTDNSRRLLQYDTQIFGRATLDGVHNAFVRARFRYRDFSPGDSFDERGDSWAKPFVDRYWYEFDLRQHMRAYEGEAMTGNLNIRAGRQFVDWGAGLALSEQLYAIRPTVEWDRRWSFEGLAGVTPPDESIVDFDASRADYNSKTLRGFYGGLLRFMFPGGQQIYAFGLHMEDYNTGSEARFATTDPVNFEYDATYLGGGSTGPLGEEMLYQVEGVYEFGDSASDPLRSEQTREDIRAWALRAMLTRLMAGENQSRVQAEVIVASGDGDRQLPTDTVGGNLAGTDDRAYNSLGYANLGLAFAPSMSNIVSARIGASTIPFPSIDTVRQLQVGADLFFFSKYDSAGPVDEPTNGQTYLGTELDLYMNYRVTSDLAVSLRYGGFIPGPAIEGDKQLRNFFLAAVTLSF